MVVKLFVKYTIMPLMQKLLNAFPSGLLKLRLGLKDQMNLQCRYVAVEDSCNNKTSDKVVYVKFSIVASQDGRNLEYS
ncbi:hypothetical protein X777_16714 [Ooceraea biroi]|uniref:Uncharacterized protein n=1 Tax=Ooceraea biroi TaxID=2015173 RepID=A0A026VTI8_OOCBI|nr:hypothetical protein X777_16714 [Ooceraea biroi]